MAKPQKKRRHGKASQVAEIQNMINAAMGKPVLKRGSDRYFTLAKIPSGSLAIDRIMGGGFTRGRHHELYGDYSSGKSLIMLRCIAHAQQAGGICALVDPEKVFDPLWFERQGGIPDELLLFQPDKEWNAEDAIGVMMLLADLVGDEKVDVIGVDSVSAMVTQEEMEKDIRSGDDRVASQARMMSRALRRITTMNKKTVFIWTNQERMNIGFGAQFNPRTQSGGRALGYYATARIEFRKTGKVKAKGKVVSNELKLQDKEVMVGNWVQVRAEKEKSTTPYGQAAFILDKRQGGIDVASEIVWLGMQDELIERHGNYLFYTDLDDNEWKLSPKNFMQELHENEVLREELIESIQDMTVQIGRGNGA